MLIISDWSSFRHTHKWTSFLRVNKSWAKLHI